jgi:hypothetical protein
MRRFEALLDLAPNAKTRTSPGTAVPGLLGAFFSLTTEYRQRCKKEGKADLPRHSELENRGQSELAMRRFAALFQKAPHPPNPELPPQSRPRQQPKPRRIARNPLLPPSHLTLASARCDRARGHDGTPRSAVPWRTLPFPQRPIMMAHRHGTQVSHLSHFERQPSLPPPLTRCNSRSQIGLKVFHRAPLPRAS